MNWRRTTCLVFLVVAVSTAIAWFMLADRYTYIIAPPEPPRPKFPLPEWFMALTGAVVGTIAGGLAAAILWLIGWLLGRWPSASANDTRRSPE